MKTTLSIAVFGLFFSPAAFGQEMAVDSPTGESPALSEAYQSLNSVNASASSLSPNPAFASFAGDLRDTEEEISNLKPADQLPAMRSASLALGSEARKAESQSGTPATSLNQGLADFDNAVGNFDAARNFAQTVLQSKPQDPDAWLSVAQSDLGSGREEDALTAAQKSATFAPQNPATWRSEAMAYASLGKKSEAEDAAKRALALNPSDKNSAALVKLLNATPASSFHLGKIATNWDNPSAGELGTQNSSFATSDRTSPSIPSDIVLAVPSPASMRGVLRNSDNRFTLQHVPVGVNALLHDAADKIAVADYASALADASQAVTIDPKNSAAYYYLAAADNMRGRYQSAIDKATRGLTINPTDVLLRDERAWASNNLGHMEDAVADANSALENNPKDAYAYANLSRANEMEGDIRSALADLRLAAELSPTFAAPYEDALRRYGLIKAVPEQKRQAPKNDNRDFDFLLVLATSLAGGSLIALGTLGFAKKS